MRLCLLGYNDGTWSDVGKKNWESERQLPYRSYSCVKYKWLRLING